MCKIPLIAVANIKEPDVAEAILAEGCCDLVGVARGHLADPAWCNKARAGKAETIREVHRLPRVLRRDRAFAARQVLGQSDDRARARVRAPERDGAGRTVAVIGGGPAGSRPPWSLQERGFHPVLFDRPTRLGGTLNVADKGIGREKITRLVDSMIAQAEESGVELRLGEEATVEKVQGACPLRRVHRLRALRVPARPRCSPPMCSGSRWQRIVVAGRRTCCSGRRASGRRRLPRRRLGHDRPRDGGSRAEGGPQDDDRRHAAADRRGRRRRSSILDLKERMDPSIRPICPGHKLLKITPKA